MNEASEIMKQVAPESVLDRLIAEAPEETQEPETESTCQNSEAMRKRLLKAGFPRRHVITIDAMHGAGLDKALELEPRVTAGDCMLILCGDRGPGKTQIATYWASQVKHPRYYRAHDLMTAARGAFSDHKAEVEESKQTLRDARRCGFLVIDEFSELAGTDYEKRTLTNLLDHRYGDMKTTVIITNAPKEHAPAEVGRSVWSRFEETGGIVLCNWPSYRKQR